jgi:hypothetical protein
MERRARVKTSGIPKSMCSQCGDVHDYASDAYTKMVPRSGDVAICVTCGYFMVFADDLSLREPTAEERAEISSDPRAQLASIAYKMWMKTQRKH